MKIAVAHYSSKNDISGVTSWLVQFIKFLTLNEHNVFLLLHHFDSKLEEANILEELVETGVDIKRVLRKNINADVVEVLNWLNIVQPNIFLPQCLHTHHLAASITGRQNLPWIATMHSDDPDYWFIIDKFKPWLTKGKIICVSNFLSSEIIRKYDVAPQNIYTIPCGVEMPQKRTKWSKEKFKVVYLGRLLETQKRISRVLEVMLDVVRNNDKIECVLIGEGNEKSQLEAIVNQESLQDRIRFTGILNKVEVVKILQDSHVIILMSDYEGVPVALMEAMSFGVVPVVRVIDSGIPELVITNETGILVDNDVKDMSSEIRLLAVEQRVWENLSEKSILHIQRNYNSRYTFENYLKVIKDHANMSDKAEYKFKMEKITNWVDAKDSRLHGYPKRDNRIKILRKFMQRFKKKIFD